MDFKEFIDRSFNPTRQYNVYYDNAARPKLILNQDNSFLSEDEIVDYCMLMPLVYDYVSDLEYEDLINANLEIGKIMRPLFGMYSPHNPYVSYTNNVFEENSPENVTHRVLKKIWYNTSHI